MEKYSISIAIRHRTAPDMMTVCVCVCSSKYATEDTNTSSYIPREYDKGEEIK